MKPTVTATTTRWVVPLILIVLALHLKSGFFAYMVYALGFLWLLSHIQAYLGYLGVDIQRDLSTTEITAGGSVKIRIRLRNNKKFPILWMFLRDWFPTYLESVGRFSAVEMVGSLKELTIAYQVILKRRGYYCFGPVVTTTGDIFGLNRRNLIWPSYGYVTVLPDYHDLTQYLPLHHRPIGEFRVQQMIYEDPTRFMGVRDYRAGDSLKHIHWQALARTAKLMTKVYETTRMEGAYLILDLYRPDYDKEAEFYRSELIIKIAASVAHLIARRRQKVGFISNAVDAGLSEPAISHKQTAASLWESFVHGTERWEQDRLGLIKTGLQRGDQSFRTVLRLLARLEVTNRLPLWRMLLDEYPALPRDALMLVLTPKISSELELVLTEMKRSGFALKVFVVQAADKSVKGLPWIAAGIPVYVMRDIEDLKRVAVAVL